MLTYLSVITALLLDIGLGEPKSYHPLVGFGRIVLKLEKLSLRQHTAYHWQTISGLFAWLLLVVPCSAFIYQLQHVSEFNLYLSPIVLYFCIAPTSLKQHGMEVFIALAQHDLPLARQKVAMIVSRETSQMDEIAIRRATIESLLENGADAIFAPLFWFVIAGAAGAVFYRLSNTLDAMWGYKNHRYRYFGSTAARMDDVLNWIPARLTAISYVLLGNTRLAWHCWQTQAQLLESPNAGVVMTAGAGALNLQLGGTAYYAGQLTYKPLFGGQHVPENTDIARANKLINKVLLLWLAMIMFFFIAY